MSPLRQLPGVCVFDNDGPVAGYFGLLSLFFLFAVCWPHFHIVKQQYGFVMLYKAKNKERDKFELKLDRWFLIGSLWVPLAGFVILGYSRGRGWFGGAPAWPIWGSQGSEPDGIVRAGIAL